MSRTDRCESGQRITIDGTQFVRDGGCIERIVRREDLPRLVELGGTTEGLEFRIRGLLDASNKPILSVQVKGIVGLECQRCLGPVEVAIDQQTELELCADVQMIDAADDDIDRVLASNAMDVYALVEDEIMLALPMVPRHDECEQPTSEDQPVAEPNPWAVLAQRRS